MSVRSLSLDQVRAIAPSVFANAPHYRRSEDYTFVPTSEVVHQLVSNGWDIRMASEQRIRKDKTRMGFQKHMLRLRRKDQMAVVGESLVEIVLINSHDGTSTYQLMAGLFRLVCSNGLVIPDGMCDSVRVKHKGFTPDQVLNASYRIIDDIPVIGRSVEAMKEVELSTAERRLFAQSALELKYGDKAPVRPDQVLIPRRDSDMQPTLWHTFNRVQENMTKGGIHGRSATSRRRTTTRGVHSIDEDVRLNKALWSLAEGMRKLKAA